MAEALIAAFGTIVFPGLLFTALVGLYFTWVDRKITARIQSRIGPPWWQPYADILKLLQKKMIIPRGSKRAGFLLAPLLGLAGVTLAATIIWAANLWPGRGFVGDLIVVIYLLAVPALALILGGAASGSPFGALGAGREMQMVLAYELPFLLAIVVAILKVGGTDVEVESRQLSALLLPDYVLWQAVKGSIAMSPSGAIALVVAFLCMQAKLGVLPFDQPEAETELIGGPLAEYSGPGLALFKVTHAMMFVVMPVFLTTLYLGGSGLTVDEAGAFHFTSGGWLLFAVKVLVLFVLVVVVKSTHARLRLDQVLRLYWGRLSILALVAVLLALVGW